MKILLVATAALCAQCDLLAQGTPTPEQIQAREDYLAARADAATLRVELDAAALAVSEAEGRLASARTDADDLIALDPSTDRFVESMERAQQIDYLISYNNIKLDALRAHMAALRDVLQRYAQWEIKALALGRALNTAREKLRVFGDSAATRLEPPIDAQAAQAEIEAAINTQAAELAKNRGGIAVGVPWLMVTPSPVPQGVTRYTGELARIQQRALLVENENDSLAEEERRQMTPASPAAATSVPAPIPEVAHPADDLARLEARRTQLTRDIELAETSIKTRRAEADQLGAALTAARDRLATAQSEYAGIKEQAEIARRSLLESRRYIGQFSLEEQVRAHNLRFINAQSAARRLESRLTVVEGRIARRTEAAREARTDLARLDEAFRAVLMDTLAWRSLRVGIAVLAAVGILWLVRIVVKRRIQRKIAATAQVSEIDRARRARTLLGTFQAGARVVVLTATLMYGLAQFNVDYAPLLVAAGGLSLAVGFGAQTLIRDIISGLFIVIENQFRVGDIVEIAGKSGTVETINLRTTVLRGFDGALHVIPNSLVDRVSNQTRGWSRAIVDVSVHYKEDVDKVVTTLNSVGKEMREHADWGPKILDFMVMGVEALADSSVNVRVALQTLPGEQWGVARQFRRRVKRAFEAAGIEIPFPHRSVVMVQPREPEAAPSRAEKRALARAQAEGDNEVVPSIEVRDKQAAIHRAAIEHQAVASAGRSPDTVIIAPVLSSGEAVASPVPRTPEAPPAVSSAPAATPRADEAPPSADKKP